MGGTVNAGGPLRVQVTRVGADTALAQIVRLVETAQVRGWSAGGWVPESDSACFVGTGLPFFCPCLSSECSKVIAAICLPCHAFHADEQGTHPSLCRPRVRCVCARHRGTGAPDLGGVVSASAGHLLCSPLACELFTRQPRHAHCWRHSCLSSHACPAHANRLQNALRCPAPAGSPLACWAGTQTRGCRPATATFCLPCCLASPSSSSPAPAPWAWQPPQQSWLAQVG